MPVNLKRDRPLPPGNLRTLDSYLKVPHRLTRTEADDRSGIWLSTFVWSSVTCEKRSCTSCNNYEAIFTFGLAHCGSVARPFLDKNLSSLTEHASMSALFSLKKEWKTYMFSCGLGICWIYCTVK